VTDWIRPGDARSLAGAFALVVVAECVAQALGVVYPSLLAAVPDWQGSSLVVGALLAFGVGVGGTSALYARWTHTEVGFGLPDPRAVAPAAVGAAAVGVVTGPARGGGAPISSLPVLMNVAIGPALLAAVGYGLLFAVVAERARAATDSQSANCTPCVVALAGAVVAVVPFRLPLAAPVLSKTTLALLTAATLVVCVGAVAARLPGPGVVGLAALIIVGGAVAGSPPGAALGRVVAVGLAAIAYEQNRSVVSPVAVLAAFRVAAAV
jgi:hypothetical protein